jgi:sugar (pentulose or hexulose) kinase
MAGVGVGAFGDLSEVARWVKSGQRIVPADPRPSAYETAYTIYRELYTQTKGLMHRLAAT